MALVVVRDPQLTGRCLPRNQGFAGGFISLLTLFRFQAHPSGHCDLRQHFRTHLTYTELKIVFKIKYLALKYVFKCLLQNSGPGMQMLLMHYLQTSQIYISMYPSR